MAGGKEGRGLKRILGLFSSQTVFLMLDWCPFLCTFSPVLYIFTFICTCLFGASRVSGKEEVGCALAQRT